MAMSRSTVAVIGGGIVGSTAAYHLARSGVSVTLVDRADDGHATAAGAGILTPGTDLGLPDSSLPLAFESFRYYTRLVADLAEDGERDAGYERSGLMHVAMTEAEADVLPRLVSRLRERKAAGAPGLDDISLLDREQASTLFPALGRTHGAVYVGTPAKVNGRTLRDAIRRAAQRRRARLLYGGASLVVGSGGELVVSVDGQPLRCDSVLLATGAWSSELARSLGINIPIKPQRGQILHLDVPGVRTGKWPIIVGFHSHYLLTFPEHRVVAGATHEDVGFEYRVTAGGMHEVLSEALRVAPGLADARFVEMRAGFRPVAADGMPVLGRLPGFRNAYIAAGHGAHGLQLGPYSGMAVADLLRGVEPSIDLAPFSPDRFE